MHAGEVGSWDSPLNAGAGYLAVSPNNMVVRPKGRDGAGVRARPGGDRAGVRVRGRGVWDVDTVETGGDTRALVSQMVGEGTGEGARAGSVSHTAEGLNAPEAGQEVATGGVGGGAIVFMFNEVPVTSSQTAGPVRVREGIN